MRTKRLISMLASLLICLSVQAQAKVTVEIWPIWADSAVLLNDALKPVLAQNPDIEIVVTQVPKAQQTDKLVVSMAAGAPPDIVMMLTPLAGKAMQGMLTPLDNMVAASKMIRPQDYPPGMLDLFRVNGSLYAIPGIEVGPNNGLIMNADMLEEAGIPAKAPATLDELFSIGKKATKMQGDQITQLGYYPMSGTASQNFAESWPFLWDLTLFDPVKRKMNIDTPAMLNMLQYVKSYHDAIPAAAVQTFIAKNGNTGWQNMRNGKIAIQWNGYYAPGRLITAGAMDKYRFQSLRRGLRGTWWLDMTIPPNDKQSP